MQRDPVDYPTYRGLRDAFGPGARLHVEPQPRVPDPIAAVAGLLYVAACVAVAALLVAEAFVGGPL